MDSYAEQIVKKADDGSDNAKRTACLIGGIAAGIFFIYLGMVIKFAFIGALLGAGAFYAGLYLGTNYDVEYEYLIVNGEIDIDKIMAKKRRKNMLTVNVASFENFGLYTNDTKDDESAAIVWAVGAEKNYDTYFADFTHETLGKCRLLFSPSDKFLREIKLHLKGQLKNTIGDLPAEEEY